MPDVSDRNDPTLIMQKKYYNVAESWTLYDTILVGPQPSGMNVEGWMADFPDLGNLNDINFFNVRNRNVGLPYNNQDTRDQLPYGFYIESIGIAFFATIMTQFETVPPGPEDFMPEKYESHIFSVDLPNHCSVRLKLNQDERLKTMVPFCPPGYGPMGDAYGQGQPSLLFGPAVDTIQGIVTQGMPQLNNRWLFPSILRAPRRAALSIKLQFSEYAKQLLQSMSIMNFQGAKGFVFTENPIYAGIQVSLMGRRLVQQRGQLHA